MNRYSQETLGIAYNIHCTLLETGVIAGGELCRRYMSEVEVRDILRDVICPRSHTAIFESEGSLYILRSAESSMLVHENEEIKRRIQAKTNTELYTAYFAILCLVSLFYKSDDPVCSVEYVRLEDLEGFITETLEEVQTVSDELKKKVDLASNLQLAAIAKFWLDMANFEVDKDPRRSRSNRIDFILRACRLIEDEGYVQVLDNSEIKIEKQFKKIIEYAFYNDQRKEMLLNALHKSLLTLDDI